jgi:hypothetical protein
MTTMSENKLGVDQRQENTPENQTPEQTQQPEVNEVEKRAREQGWVPKDEWTGDPAAWRPADVFVDRGELLGRIKSQSAELREVKQMMNYLSEQNRKLYEAGYERAVAEMQARRDAAIEAGDTAAVRNIDKEMRNYEKALEEARKPAPKTDTNTTDPLFEDWSERNPWYNRDEVLTDWTNGRAVKLRAINPKITEAEMYKVLEAEVRKTFPEKFKRVGAPSPDGASNRGAGSPARKGGDSDFEALLDSLSEDEAQIARNLVKRGHVTKEEFMESIKLVGGIKR